MTGEKIRHVELYRIAQNQLQEIKANLESTQDKVGVGGVGCVCVRVCARLCCVVYVYVCVCVCVCVREREREREREKASKQQEAGRCTLRYCWSKGCL